MHEAAKASDEMNADTRYSFTAQFLCSSAIFARRGAAIESANPQNIGDLTATEHRGFVTATIMQCVAAVESESAEVTRHGPSHHLGSGGIDTGGRDFLNPLSELIDGEDAIERFKLILHILRRPSLDMGAQACQDMAILIKVRNEITHYKSKWGTEMEREKLFKSTLPQLVQARSLTRPPFISSSHSFFPHQFLSAATAAWSVRTAVSFLNTFYDRLGVESVLKPYMTNLHV